ncbi:MAG: hypothetical protein CFE23_11730 [Flavobacterium sp. BFFFF1]|nr:MAG: hypothetical protein CFE23_11730 [Flavobacterium sp. BFFFF1]
MMIIRKNILNCFIYQFLTCFSPKKQTMKTTFLILWLASATGFAQHRYSETKISQLIRPEYNTSSHLIVTVVLAKEPENDQWTPIFEHKVLVKRFKDSSEKKLQEYALAEAAGKKIVEEEEQEFRNRQMPVPVTEINER